MRKRKQFLAASMTMLLSAMSGLSAMAQINSEPDTTFHPHGTPVVTVFANAHATGSESTTYGFNLDRVYLGYQYEFAKGLSAKAVFDIGKSSDVEDLQRLAYVKNAFVQWQHADLVIKAGLIGTTQFDAQEKLWNRRYLYKSFQDEYKFGSSADLGVSANYRFAKWFAADVEIVNGEGYKKIQADNQLLYAVGLTFNPVKDLTLRVYGDIAAPGKQIENGKPKENLSAFIGWKQKKFSIGVENNWLFHNQYGSDKHQMGISAYSAVAVGKNWEIFGRWDYLTSKGKWNESKDGNLALLGCQYSPIKHLKMSPNVRLWVPADHSKPLTWGAYFNLEFKL